MKRGNGRTTRSGPNEAGFGDATTGRGERSGRSSLRVRLAAASRMVVAFSRRLTLTQRFALACLVVLLTGAAVIGKWVSWQIEEGVIHRTSAITATYANSFLTPHLTSLRSGGGLDQHEREELTDILEHTELGKKVVSFKVWSTAGQVLFATDPTQIGQIPPESGDLRTALGGRIDSHLSDLDEVENRAERARFARLLETYSPVFGNSGEVVGAVEFYELPDDLLAELRGAERNSWAIIGTSTVVMYLLLVGLVAGASRTITRQNRNLTDAVEQQQSLQSRIRALNQRLRRAAGAKALTDEQVLHRIAQDLHDGPAQDLSLALLRLDSIPRSESNADDHESFDIFEFAVRRALEEVRSITSGLNTPQLSGLSWRDTVAKAADEHIRRTGDQVHVEVLEVDSEPTAAQRIATYRVVQEALGNASRHSGTHEQRVRLRRDGGWAEITVDDRGVGLQVSQGVRPEERRARLGIQGMRERVELLGGEFSISSSPGEGTRVVARIPLAEGDDRGR